MDKETKMAFIPKKSLARESERRARPVGMFLSLAFLIFFAVLVIYGGLYFYKANLEKSLAEKTLELEAEKKRADPSSVIEQAEALRTTIESAKQILGSHTAVSRIFPLLEELTLQSVTFSSLSLGKAAGATDSSLSLKLKGIAPSYSSLAYQSDVLKKEVESGKRIISFSVSSPTPNERGGVSFGLDISLHPAFLSYADALSKTEPKNTVVATSTPEVPESEKTAKEKSIE